MSTSVGPCAGLRVIDLSASYPGALATMVLADAGAEVVKVEPPNGDPTRAHYAAAMWHRGKKSVVLDLKTSRGVAEARRLASGADVLLETFRPGVADRLGIGYAELSKDNPGLVYCGITGFGARGPLAGVKGYEGVVAAAVGRMDVFSTMVEKDGPVFASLPLASYGAAMLSIHGIMAALLVRAKTGRGQKVDTSLLQALTCYDLMGTMNWQLAQRSGEPLARGYPGSTVPPYMAARTRDGHWLQFGNLTVNTLYNFLSALGLAHLLKDPRYKDMPTFADPRYRSEVHRMCLEKVLERDRDDWMRLFMEADVACEPFRTTQEGLRHDQVVYNGNVIERHHPTLGAVKQLGPLAKFSATPMEPGWPPPTVGEHTREVLSAPQQPRAAMKVSGPWPAHPLSGVTVLEFATYIAVPFMTALLADLGARVIKVEPITGDLARGGNWPKMCKTFQGKEGLSIDLKDPRCQEALHKLVRDTDIVVHNYRPGVPERLGLDYETLRRINPRLVYIYAAAYGSTGPHSHRAAFHVIAGAIAGSPRFQLGRRLPPPPDKVLSLDEVRSIATSMQRSNETNPDPVSALANAAVALMALHARERTGQGQYIETWMICSNLYANADDALSYEGKPERMLADEEYNGLHALYRLYRTKEGWLFLACPREDEWAALARALGLGKLLEDPRFAKRTARLRNDRALSEILGEALARRPAAEWQALMTAQDIACVQVPEMDFGGFLNTTPWIKEAGYLAQVEHPSLGTYWRHAPPYVFSETPGRAGANIFLGEHTRSILAELGYGPEAIAQLEREGVVVCHGWPCA